MNLAELREKIHAIEWQEQKQCDVVSFGVPEIDNALPQQGLVTGAVHEWLSDNLGPTVGFVALILGRIAKKRGPILWCGSQPLYTLGLEAFGLRPDDIVFVQASDQKEALWALEEGLQSQTLGAVVGERVQTSMTISRRLQLAANQSGVSAFLLPDPKQRAGATSCALTRWRIAPLPSITALDRPCFSVELLRSRGGAAPLRWNVMFDAKTLSLNLCPPRVPHQSGSALSMG